MYIFSKVLTSASAHKGRTVSWCISERLFAENVTRNGNFKISHRNFTGLYNSTYLLTPWSRVLLEKLASLQLVKKFPAFYETQRFLTAHTSARHLSLSWASPIQSSYPNPTSWRSILILSSHLRLGLPSGLFPSGFHTSTLYTPLSSPIRATCPPISFF